MNYINLWKKLINTLTFILEIIYIFIIDISKYLLHFLISNPKLLHGIILIGFIICLNKAKRALAATNTLR